MDRFKRSSIFWVLLLVTAFSPALLANKQVHQAKLLKPGGSGNGSSVLVLNQSGPTYIVRTFASPGFVITSAALSSSGWSIPLCTNGGPVEDDCTYDAGGNLFLEGALTPSMLLAAGVTGGQFNLALQDGTLSVVLSDGTSGVYVRII